MEVLSTFHLEVNVRIILSQEYLRVLLLFTYVHITDGTLTQGPESLCLWNIPLLKEDTNATIYPTKFNIYAVVTFVETVLF